MRLSLMQSGTQGAAGSDIQREIQQTIQDAQRAAQDAAKDAAKALQDAQAAAGEPQPAQAPNAPGDIVFPGDGGNNIRLSVDGKGIKVCQEESCTTIPIQDVVPRGAVLMTYAVFGSLAFMVVGYPIARAFARWLDRRGQSVGPSRELQARLDAMERNIDAAAMEIERVGEGQRFTNRLLEQRPVEHAQRSDR